MNDLILSASHVCKRFATHTALDDVSIDVQRGHIFGLLGHNGAGKTTLIRIINHITAPDSGTVTFDGHPLTQNDVAHIGYLPEERGLYKKMKVGEQAVYLAEVSDVRRRFRDNTYSLTAAGEMLQPVDRLFEITEAGAPDAEGHRTYLLRKSPDVTNAELLRHLTAQVEPIAFAEHLPTMRDIFVRTVGADLSTPSAPDHE